METRNWIINYVSCEGNDRWLVGRFPLEFEAWEVECRFKETCYGCGDDPAEFISCEIYWDQDEDVMYDYT